jgi:hypothetical protein
MLRNRRLERRDRNHRVGDQKIHQTKHLTPDSDKYLRDADPEVNMVGSSNQHSQTFRRITEPHARARHRFHL